jgi:hypothetical protein
MQPHEEKRPGALLRGDAKSRLGDVGGRMAGPALKLSVIATVVIPAIRAPVFFPQ